MPHCHGAGKFSGWNWRRLLALLPPLLASGRGASESPADPTNHRPVLQDLDVITACWDFFEPPSVAVSPTTRSQHLDTRLVLETWLLLEVLQYSRSTHTINSQLSQGMVVISCVHDSVHALKHNGLSY